MAPIKQFSRIILRNGKVIDLPTPLQGSELGHVLDERRLFIGNGELVDGAPEVGNTELLTEFSDNIELIKHIYESNTPNTPQTGPTGNDPTIRTLREVLDDNVSVKAFGALGNGVNDDSIALNRAMKEIYTTVIAGPDPQEQAYRIVFIPAGIYNLDAEKCKIPPYTFLLGEGKDRVIIRMVNTAQDGVIETVDSLFQTDAQIGDSGATFPTNIRCVGISFEHAADKDILLANRASNILFEDCGLKGGWIAGVSTKLGIKIDPIGLTYIHENIRFRNCSFGSVGKVMDLPTVAENANGIHFEDCTFKNTHEGVIVDAKVKDIKIINSHFENIEGRTVYAGALSESVISENNVYKNCSTPGIPVIKFNNNGIDFASMCSSLNDRFELQLNVVNVENLGVDSIILNPQTDFIMRNITITKKSDPIILTQGVTNAPTNLLFDTNKVDSLFIDYTLKRGTELRIGRITLITDGTVGGSVINDVFTETGATNITFNFTIIGSDIILTYTATAGVNAELHAQTKFWKM